MNYAPVRTLRSDFGSSRRFAGVELGGTKCVCTLARSPDAIFAQQIVRTTSPDETLAAIVAILSGWWDDGGFDALGIASFGPVELDPAAPAHGAITSTAKPGWRDSDVLGPLSAKFPVPVTFDTDVNAAAIAECAWGAGRGLDDFAYITVGTGVGVGLIINGRPTRGFAHCELGHIRVARIPGDTWPGACPYHGACVEGLASGSAIQARLGGRPVAEIGPDEPLWDGVAHAIAQLCHVLVCTAAPRRIALAGGVIARQPHLLQRIEPLLVESLAGYIELPGKGPYVIAPELGDMAGPLGPIALAEALAPA